MPAAKQIFPRTDRVLADREFKQAKISTIKARSKALMISFVPGAVKRLGVIAPKASGNAVQRSKLKRVARDFFRRNKEKFSLGDSVVVFYTNSGNMSPSEIRECLDAVALHIAAIVERKK